MYGIVRELLADENRREEMSRKLRSMVQQDSAAQMCDIVEELAKR